MSIKEVKRHKNLEFMADDVTLSKLEAKAVELQKSFICLESKEAGGKVLVIDYDNVEKDFESARERMQLLSLINDCAVANNTTLELSSRNLADLTFLDRRT